MRKFNFTNRVISVWNILPDTVVSANTIDTFKARLDRFWSDQEVKYNWKSDIHLEFCTPAWSPHYRKDRDLIEKIQRRFTRMIPNISKLP